MGEKMIVKDDFLKKLRASFNLNIYEAKIWTALLSKGVATAGELSDISGVPRSRSYDVLESLEKRGFIIIKLGKPIKYIAVKPEEIVKREKKNIVDKSKEQVDLLDKVRETNTFKEMQLLYKQGIIHVEPSSLSGTIRGRNNLRNHIETMLENAKSTVSIMTTTSGFLRKAEDHRKTLKKLKDKNVKIRIHAPLTNEEAKKIAKEIKEIADVKHIEQPNARFVVIDGKELLFMIENDKDIHESYDMGVWVNTPYFANALEKMLNA